MMSADKAAKKQKTEGKAAEDKGKVVLVTGGSGLVGRAIETVITSEQEAGRITHERWIFLSSKDGDLRDFGATKAIFELHQPTHCIHAAAFVGGLFKNLKYKVEFYRHNTQMNDNVMECCRVYKVMLHVR